MSNPLSVRRVKVQTIDDSGNPIGEPSFGVMAADSYAQAYNDTFENLDELNDAIEDQGSIIKVIDNWEELFGLVDFTVVTTDNYYGKNWNLED